MADVTPPEDPRVGRFWSAGLVVEKESGIIVGSIDFPLKKGPVAPRPAPQMVLSLAMDSREDGDSWMEEQWEKWYSSDAAVSPTRPFYAALN